MANFFSSLFNRRLNVNVYGNSVTEPVTFDDLTFQDLELLYTTIPDARIIEDFIADNIAKISVKVVNTRDTEVKNTPLNQLIEQPNPNQSWEELVKEALVFYGLTGNAFINRTDNGYLYTLATSDTYVNLAKDKTIPEFLNFIDSYRLELGGIQYPILEADMFHLKTASLSGKDGLWAIGTSPYQSGKQNIKTLEATYSSRVSMIRDRGALGFISNESEVPDAEQSQIVQDALETYGTREEQKKYIVTTQKLKYNQMALGASELELLPNLGHDFKSLCQLRGLDALIFGSEGSTYANQAEARKAAVKNVIIPLAEKFYSKFNEWLAQWYGGLKIEPEFETLPEFGEINTELSSKVINEVRAGLLTPEQALEMLYPELEYIKTENDDIRDSGEPATGS